MPSETTWLLQHRVIYARSYGEVTMHEVYVANQEIINHIQEGIAAGSPQVHLFNNALDVKKQPSMLEASRVFTYLQEPGLGWVVVGGMGNPMITFFVKLVSQVSNRQIITFPLPEQALDYLNQKDSTLPNLKPLFHDMLSKE